MSVRPIAAKRPESVLDPKALSASLSQAGVRDPSLPSLEIERGWPLAKIPLLLRCSEPGVSSERSGWWSFYFLHSGKMPFSCRSALKDHTAVYLEDLHAVAQAFPQDLLLSRVDQSVSRRTGLETLRAAVSGEEDHWQSMTSRVVSYKPSRRLTTRYRLQAAGGRGKTIFGKQYPKGEDLRTLQVHGALSRAIAESRADRFSLAQIVGRVPEWNALLWRRVPGRSVLDLLRSAAVEESIRRVSRYLAELHRSDIQFSRSHDRERELQTVSSWINAVSFADLGHRIELERTYGRLQELMPRAKFASLAPSHRDFYDKQILIDGDRCTLLDLELASRAEPELDVANFVAHLELRSLQSRIAEAKPLMEIFVQEYSRASARPNEARLRWYLASSFLRLACVYSFRSEWFGLVPALLDAASRSLDEMPVLIEEGL